MHPDPNFTGPHEVSDSRVRNLLRASETCQYGGERDREKQPFHARLQGNSDVRPQHAAARAEFRGDLVVCFAVAGMPAPILSRLYREISET